jgi:hypothetical protein
MLLVEIPIEGGTLDLTIAAHLSDGTVIERSVTIQNATGEVQPLAPGASRAPLFDEMLRQQRAN